MNEDRGSEVTTCLRALLTSPILQAHQDPDTFTMIKRNADTVQRWFTKNLGYHLYLDQNLARLLRRPLPTRDTTHPATTNIGLPFNRQRYVVLCLALAVLERNELQIDLAGLAEGIKMTAATHPATISVNFAEREDRRALVDVVRYLTTLGALELRDGDEHAFLDNQGNALYDISKPVILKFISAPVPPSTATSPAELQEEVYADTEEGAQDRMRHRVMRRLVEEPVLYFDELSPDEQDFLSRHEQSTISRLQDLGLVVEVRREGIAALDPEGELAHPKRFPGEGTLPQAALLLADPLVKMAGETQLAFVPSEEIVQMVGQLKSSFGPYWRQEYASDGGTERLALEACSLLVDFKLLRQATGGYDVLPALARFAAGYSASPTLRESASP